MLDLNHILLFIAVATPVILLWRLRRLGSARPQGWIVAAFIVLLGTILSYLLAPALAGFIGGGLWASLLLAPSLLERKIAGVLVESRDRTARRLTLVRRILHPWSDPGPLPFLLRALELAQVGQLHPALDLLATSRTPATAATTFALEENWRGLVEWCRRDLTVTNEPGVQALYLRALGETGALEDLAWSFAAHSQTLEPRLTISPGQSQALLYLLAFAGRPAGLRRLFHGPLARLPRAHQQFWLATAELAAGETGSAVKRLTKLGSQTGDAILDRSIAHRLATARAFPVAQVKPATAKLLTRLLDQTNEPKRTVREDIPAVWILIALNLLAFLAEIVFGGSTNDQTLHLLGALEPSAVLRQHQYWRVLTACFLHYGPLHISVNLFALYFLGPDLEKSLGSLKFVIGYLLSGIGSGLLVVALYALHLTNNTELVGASGAVMGLIGISAGLLLRHRQTPLAGRRLKEILGIVAFQTVFDLATPQVSLAAHLSGFLTGILIGIVFAARRAD